MRLERGLDDLEVERQRVARVAENQRLAAIADEDVRVAMNADGGHDVSLCSEAFRGRKRRAMPS
jgi:hypothetical protein